jgi:hypothetical protein
MADRMLNAREVADRIGKTVGHVYNLRRLGALTASDVRSPGATRASWVFRESAVEAYLNGSPAVGANGRALLTVVPDVPAVA